MFSLQALDHHFYTSQTGHWYSTAHDFSLSYSIKGIPDAITTNWKSFYTWNHSLLLNKQHIRSNTPTRYDIYLILFVRETLLNVTFTCSFGYLTFVDSYPLQRYTTLKITPSLLQMMTKNKDKYCISSDSKGTHILKQTIIQGVECYNPREDMTVHSTSNI